MRENRQTPCLPAATAGNVNIEPMHEPARQSPLCRPVVIAVLAIALVLLFTAAVPAAGPFFGTGPVHLSKQKTEKSTLVEARLGYLWGMNEIWLRDGDNGNIAPAKKEMTLNSPALGLLVETFVRKDLAIRVQGWANYPVQQRNDFFFDGTATAWDTDARHFSVDLAAIYHLCLSPMPYTAGLIGGYRYYNFDYPSDSVAAHLGTFHDHIQVHVPHVGVYYAHSRFLGSVVRFDFLASPVALSVIESQRARGATSMNIEGHALTGIFLETYFAWARPVAEDIFLGLFGRYNYLELSGGATAKRGPASTRFSLDSRHHLFLTGITVGYTF